MVISGYVSILFGRSRSSEDVDLFIEKIGYDKFEELWELLKIKFECLTTDSTKTAYDDYLMDKSVIRFSYEKIYVPNMEIKFPKVEIEEWALENSVKVLLNDEMFFISSIELQIPVKLNLGSDKDIEDARHLYRVFKDNLNMGILLEFNKKFNIQELFNNSIK